MMHLHRLASVVTLCALPVSLWAQDTAGRNQHANQFGRPPAIGAPPTETDVTLSCVFATECYEDEACQSSGYGVMLEGKAGGMDAEALLVEVAMSSVSGDTFLVGVQSGGIFSLSGGGFDARHMLTIGADGAARYSVHYSDPVMVLTYHGQCMETE